MLHLKKTKEKGQLTNKEEIQKYVTPSSLRIFRVSLGKEKGMMGGAGEGEGGGLIVGGYVVVLIMSGRL